MTNEMKNVKRFWNLLNYQEFNTKKENEELQELYNELYDEGKFTAADLEYIDLVW